MDKCVAAVVVTHNRKELLLECIDALRHQSVAGSIDIIVVDNASTDGTSAALAPLAQEAIVDYYNTGSNLGGAGGFSFGVRLAVERGYGYVWIMDDDCIPSVDALEKLLEADELIGGSWGFLASKVEWTDGSLCKMNEVKLKGGVRANSKFMACRQASFVSLLVKADVVKEHGLPIKDFFIWGDDVEYTRRLSSFYASYYVPDSVVVHKTASNKGSDISRDSDDRLERYRYAYRNEVYIARQEGISRIAYQAAKTVYHIARVLLHAPSKKRYRCRIILESSMQGISFNPKIELPECKKR